MSDNIDRIALLTFCPYCNVGPGHWCVSTTGNVTRWLHARRTEPVYALWYNGYAEGEREGIHFATRNVDDPHRIARYVQSLDKWIKEHAA